MNEHNRQTILEPYLPELEAASGMSVRLYEPADDDTMPETFLQQPVVAKIIRFAGEKAVRRVEEEEAIAQEVAEELEMKSRLVGIMVATALAASPDFRDSLMVAAPSAKSMTSIKMKAGRRYAMNPQDMRRISDLLRTTIEPAHTENDTIDEVADAALVSRGLSYLQKCFNVSDVDRDGKACIESLGNASSRGVKGKQAKLHVNINGQTEFFEVQGLTTLERQIYQDSREEYEDERLPVSRAGFQQLLGDVAMGHVELAA